MHNRSQNNWLQQFSGRVRLLTEKQGLWLLSAVIVGMALLYHYPETLLKRPQSTHNWRQCDGASLALNYYQEGMQFFKPRTHGLYSDNYTTGYTAPSEIPILYFVVAFLYKVIGYHEYIFRATNLLIFFIGLMYLFRLSKAVLQSTYYSMAVVVLIFSSPLLVYYANNFMPNTVGFSFTIIGWYYFHRYTRQQRTSTYLTAVLFFLLAASMKITELTGPIIILALMFADRLGMIRLQLGTERHFFIKVSSLLGIFFAVAGWVIYAKWYNNLHGTSQFSTYTFPIWNIDAGARDFVLHKMKVIWMKEYYLPFTLYCLAGFAFLTGFFYRRANRILILVSVILFAGLVAYSILWFEALGDHDYFFIGFFMLPAVIFINTFQVLLSFKFNVVIARIIQVAVLVFLIFNVSHARQRQTIRYFSWMNDYPEMKDLYHINPYLDQKGIGRHDTIVYFSSPNIRPLYLMNLKGWTITSQAEFTEETHRKDSIMMEDCIRKGAGYLFVSDMQSLEKRKSLLRYSKDLYGKYGNILIFRIPPGSTNFAIADTLSN